MAGVADGFEGLETLGVVEDNSCQRLAVDVPLGVENPRSELASHRGGGPTIRSDDVPADRIDIDDDCAEFGHLRSSSRLPRTDSTSEADNEHSGILPDRGPGLPIGEDCLT